MSSKQNHAFKEATDVPALFQRAPGPGKTLPKTGVREASWSLTASGKTMDLFEGAERLMGMDQRAWARHANPWSAYSRLAGSLAVFFAFWSLHWIGAWGLLAIALAAAWTWLNPRLFAPPQSAESWAARGVLGERVFLNRKKVPIPEEHARLAWIATGASAGFLAIGIYGLATGAFWTAFCGWCAAVLAKVWFVDRMVWLFDVMKQRHPVYAAWSRAEWGARLDDPHD